jgi:hypothetical protein
MKKKRVVWYYLLPVAVGNITMLILTLSVNASIEQVAFLGLIAAVSVAVAMVLFRIFRKPSFILFSPPRDKLERWARFGIGVTLAVFAWFFYTGAYPPGTPPYLLGEMFRVTAVAICFLAAVRFWWGRV